MLEAHLLPEQLQPTYSYDLEIHFDALTPKLYRIINQMAPFGPKNMRPVFVTHLCKDAGGTRAVGKEDNHLKLEIIDAGGTRFQGIAFGMAQHLIQIKNQQPFSLLYTLEENEYNGKVSLQLKVKDLVFAP